MKCPHCNREGMTTSECLEQTIGKPFMVSISPIKPPSELLDAEGLMAEGYKAMAEGHREFAERVFPIAHEVIDIPLDMLMDIRKGRKMDREELKELTRYCLLEDRNQILAELDRLWGMETLCANALQDAAELTASDEVKFKTIMNDECAVCHRQVLLPSEICRKYQIQNCHVCDDFSCCDNENPLKDKAEALERIVMAYHISEGRLLDKSILCDCIVSNAVQDYLDSTSTSSGQAQQKPGQGECYDPCCMCHVVEKPKDEMLDDGFGMECSPYCPDCGRKSMSIVRPGKFQCAVCDRTEEEYPPLQRKSDEDVLRGILRRPLKGTSVYQVKSPSYTKQYVMGNDDADERITEILEHFQLKEGE